MMALRYEAGVAQLVEYELPKLGVAGSNPVARSTFPVQSVAASTPQEDFNGNFREGP